MLGYKVLLIFNTVPESVRYSDTRWIPIGYKNESNTSIMNLLVLKIVKST